MASPPYSPGLYWDKPIQTPIPSATLTRSSKLSTIFSDPEYPPTSCSSRPPGWDWFGVVIPPPTLSLFTSPASTPGPSPQVEHAPADLMPAEEPPAPIPSPEPVPLAGSPRPFSEIPRPTPSPLTTPPSSPRLQNVNFSADELPVPADKFPPPTLSPLTTPPSSPGPDDHFLPPPTPSPFTTPPSSPPPSPSLGSSSSDSDSDSSSFYSDSMSESEYEPSERDFDEEEADTQPVIINAREIIAKIENILAAVFEALAGAQPMTIQIRSCRTRKLSLVSFPSRKNSKKFAAVLQILEIVHDLLGNGQVTTKRDIYYQNKALFGSQAYADRLIDDIALTFGTSRHDLNIVASINGLVAGGPSDSGSDSHGRPVPLVNELVSLDFHSVKWILIIEKEATFRGLAASRYYERSLAGAGIIVTAKGYPDLVTRKFLHQVHHQYPAISIHALTDFDPDGIQIALTYKYGSQRLEHETHVDLPGLSWLGIKSLDLFFERENGDVGLSTSFQQQEPSPTANVENVNISPSQRASGTTPPNNLNRSICALTQRDRQIAVSMMKRFQDQDRQGADDLEMARELQFMLMLNMKIEIKAAADTGDMTEWLDQRLVSAAD